MNLLLSLIVIVLIIVIITFRNQRDTLETALEDEKKISLSMKALEAPKAPVEEAVEE